ncbi:MAG: DUF1772 domain-containing protein [Roseiarcus sp.]|jgi:hypothetical protein
MSPGSLALVLAAAFSGAALYVNLVEQPARLALEDQAMLNEWTPSDRRGVALLMGLSLLSAALGLVAYFASQDVRWAIGALIIVLSWPYTFFVMAPVNDQILTLAPRDIGAIRVLVRQWGLLEYGQTGIGVVACAVFLWAL